MERVRCSIVKECEGSVLVRYGNYPGTIPRGRCEFYCYSYCYGRFNNIIIVINMASLLYDNVALFTPALLFDINEFRLTLVPALSCNKGFNSKLY